ncbi:DUF167 domain-containing protein [Thermoproteota archaeon]
MKTINIKVFSKAKKDMVKETKNGLKVYVTSPPEKGRANVAVINVLSKYLNVKKYHITIVSGQHSKEKVIGIPINP